MTLFSRTSMKPYAIVLLSATLFGAAFPLTKLLLGELGPLTLAGYLYLASGLGVGGFRLCLKRERGEASLRGSDMRWLAAVVVFGGIAGPVLLLLGLASASAHVSAFLANTETVFTVVIAILFFGDFLTRREVLGVGMILLGATAVAWTGAHQGGSTSWQGPLLLLGAGLAWGLDNNCSQRLSGRDPLQIAAVKGIAAGGVNLALAAFLEPLPSFNGKTIGAAFGVGFVSYGLSIVLFLVALRHLGAARASSLLATSPVIALALAWIILGETPGSFTLLGAALMIPGAWLLIRTEHSHRHVHQPLEHDHRHVHDEHHQHAHDGSVGPEPHSHPHRHERLEHAHPHVADLHHHHGH